VLGGRAWVAGAGLDADWCTSRRMRRRRRRRVPQTERRWGRGLGGGLRRKIGESWKGQGSGCRGR